MKNKIGILVVSASVLGSLLMAGTAFAAGPQPWDWQGGQGQQTQGEHAAPNMPTNMMRPGIFGSVTAINGDILTVTSKAFGGPHASSTPAAATTYSVDATNATVLKNNATSTLSAIAVGDMVAVTGSVSGDSVTATTIRDGIVPGGMGGGRGRGPGMGGYASSTPRTAPYMPQGNGEPVVGGSVTAVSGSTLTVTNKSVTYTVDASSAAVADHGATSTVSSIAVGDNVVVQGSVNGTSITATSVIDQGAPKTGSSSSGPMHAMSGIVGAIGGFFQHLFGFF